MPKKYKNVPLSEEEYERLQLVAKANGYGERGMGAQVADWVKRELPPCEHVEREPVTIQYPAAEIGTDGQVTTIVRSAWYCPKCKRVYAKTEEE